MSTNHQDLSGASWRKSSFSSSASVNCVEVATNLPGIVAIRDSKHPDGPNLVVAATAWRSFLISLNG